MRGERGVRVGSGSGLLGVWVCGSWCGGVAVGSGRGRGSVGVWAWAWEVGVQRDTLLQRVSAYLEVGSPGNSPLVIPLYAKHIN